MAHQPTSSAPTCLKPTAAALEQAGRLILDGKLVIIPTDTVYGLGANATDDQAVARVFQAKERPADKPLLALVATQAMAERCAAFSERARALVDALWPGPLTLVLPRAKGSPLSSLVDRNARGVSLRLPANETTRAIIQAADRPITAPSANRSGNPSPRTAEEALADLGGSVALAIDGGPAEQPIESTLLDLTESPGRILRPGAVSAEAIERIIGAIDRG